MLLVEGTARMAVCERPSVRAAQRDDWLANRLREDFGGALCAFSQELDEKNAFDKVSSRTPSRIHHFT